MENGNQMEQKKRTDHEINQQNENHIDKDQTNQYVMGSYDVIVVGAGHAGCEAALASARMGKKTLILSINLEAGAMMACNPSIGGTGKGQLVRENRFVLIH